MIPVYGPESAHQETKSLACLGEVNVYPRPTIRLLTDKGARHANNKSVSEKLPAIELHRPKCIYLYLRLSMQSIIWALRAADTGRPQTFGKSICLSI